MSWDKFVGLIASMEMAASRSPVLAFAVMRRSWKTFRTTHPSLATQKRLAKKNAEVPETMAKEVSINEPRPVQETK